MAASASLGSISAVALREVIAYGNGSPPASISTGLASGGVVAASLATITASAGRNIEPRYLSVVEAYLQNVNCPRTARYPLTGQRGHSAYEFV